MYMFLRVSVVCVWEKESFGGVFLLLLTLFIFTYLEDSRRKRKKEDGKIERQKESTLKGRAQWCKWRVLLNFFSFLSFSFLLLLSIVQRKRRSCAFRPPVSISSFSSISVFGRISERQFFGVVCVRFNIFLVWNVFLQYAHLVYLKQTITYSLLRTITKSDRQHISHTLAI